MTRMAIRVIFVGAAAGCGNLPVSGDGVVALEVTAPTSLSLRFGQTAQLQARALDSDGEVVPGAVITWATPDTTVTVDEATGLVTAVDSTGAGRVQASVGSLRSNLITFTLQPPIGG